MVGLVVLCTVLGSLVSCVFFIAVKPVNCLIVLCTCVYWWLGLCSFLTCYLFVIYVIVFVEFVVCC